MPETLIQDAFKTATIGMAFIGLDGKWMRANSSLCDMLGYEEQELAALMFQAIAFPEDPEPGRPTVYELFRGEADKCEGEQRFYRKDGNILWGVLGACLVRDGNGQPRCYFVHVHDITARKGTEQLRQAIFELPTALHFVADFDGYFKKLSPSWSDVLGYPMEYLLSIPYLDLVHPDDRRNTIEEARRVTEGFNTFLFENRYRHADGSYRWILWTSISKTDEGLVYGVALDYTTRKEMELDLERTLREAKSLLADLTASQKEITKLREGLLTVCAWTKRIHYDGRWMSVDEFLRDHVGLNLTHGMSEEAVVGMMAEMEPPPTRDSGRPRS